MTQYDQWKTMSPEDEQDEAEAEQLRSRGREEPENDEPLYFADEY